jgi:hypothetical protein
MPALKCKIGDAEVLFPAHVKISRRNLQYLVACHGGLIFHYFEGVKIAFIMILFAMFKKTIIIFIFSAITIACDSIYLPIERNAENRLILVGDGYSRTSVNTSIFRKNSLVTHHDTQYIAYYDLDGWLVLGKRRLKESIFELRRSSYKGNCIDAHNSISIIVDGDGYLHVVLNNHDSPLNYYKSIKSGSLELGESLQMLGYDEDKVTYPEFYLLSSGDLLFVYRSGTSGNGNMVINSYSVENQAWERIQDIFIGGQDQRNAYWQLFIDQRGTIHCSWVWREAFGVETNHDLCYARSKDGGKTWERSNGESYTLPITAANAEYVCFIPQKRELINQTSMTADEDGNPYIATYWKDEDSDVPQYRLVWFDDRGGWNQQQVSARTAPFSLSGGGTKLIPIARPLLVVKAGRIYYFFRDEERGSKVSLAISNNIANGKWTYRDLTDFSVDAWESTYDTELWKNKGKLHLYVQRTGQLDGEGVSDMHPQSVYVLEVNI